MSREWKPGDVALATWDQGRTGGRDVVLKLTDGWTNSVGFLGHGDVTDARPLVVIDPEDREQVERLLARFVEAVDASFVPAHPRGWSVPSMQTALRSLIEPPKPEEPTGLGAVVEDADGRRYVLVSGDDEAPWAQMPAGEWQIECFAWHEFTAVRVLSEGVTA